MNNTINCIRTIPVWPFTWFAPREHKPLEIDEREQARRNAIKLDLESKISSMEQRLLEISSQITGLTDKLTKKVGEQLQYGDTHNGQDDPVIQTKIDAIWKEKQHCLQVYRRQTELLLKHKKKYSDIIELMHSHEVERDFLILSNELGLPNTDQVDDVTSISTEIDTEVNMGIKTITTPSPLSQFMINTTISPSSDNFSKGGAAGGGGMQTLDYESLMHDARMNRPSYKAMIADTLPPQHTPGSKIQQQPIVTTSTTTTTQTQTKVTTKQPLVLQKLFKTSSAMPHKTQG